MSISSEISRLTQAKADIKSAIENKGVTVPSSAKLDDYPDLIDDIEQGSTPNLQTKSVSITENGTTTVEPDPGYDGLSEVGVSVNVQGGGGGGASEDDDVRFIDYDGTLLYSYSASEFLALTSMPENPTHEGLTSQGWNWSLADAKEQVTKMGTCDIGQMYITDDGKTEIDVHFPDDARLSPILTIAVNGAIMVDWGDNTTPNTVTGTSLSTRNDVPHTYVASGDYTIKITSVSGKFTFYGASTHTILRKNTNKNENRVYANLLKAVRLGSGVTSIGSYAFQSCYSLASVTIPSGVTIIGTNAFQYCYSLASVTIPSGVTSIRSYAFQNCYSLASVTIPSGVTSIETNAFTSCYSLASVTIPSGVTSIGTYAFQYCYSLASVTIPSGVTSIETNAFTSCYSLASVTIPSGVTSIGNNAFQYCYSLASVTIPSGVTIIGTNAFQYCYSLASVTIPSGVTSIRSYAFQNCYSLASVTIPSGVTSIGTYAFQNCYSLASVTIPSGVTSIGNNAFSNCYGMEKYHLLPATPPSLGGTNVFQSIVSDCKIYVPAESLEAYKSAQYWSSHDSKIVGE